MASRDALSGKTVLLVDDRLYSGAHMAPAYKYLRSMGADVRRFVFAHVQHPSPQTAPDEYAYIADSSDIPFPWESTGSTQWDGVAAE